MKPFAWSYSRLKNYETCALRHQQIDLLKNFAEKQEKGGALDWGNQVHAALATTLRDSVALPDDMVLYQKWIDRIKAGPGQLLVEQKFAITKDFKPTSYFSDMVWYRGIGDVLRIDGPVALVIDWKTGKILVDSVQLMLMAQCVFSHYPQVRKVRSEFIWLKDDCTTPEVFDRSEMADSWIGLLDRVRSLEEAYNTNTYHAKPGRLCRNWCPVKSCQYHGKGG